MLNILKKLSLLTIVCTLSYAAYADEIAKIKKLTTQVVNNVMQLLENTKLDKETRNQKIITEIKDLFDFEKMAKLSLGKKYWTTMTAHQRTQFINLFVKKLEKSYLEKLELYTDERVVIKKAEHPIKKGRVNKSRMIIDTSLVKGSNEIAIIYKLYFDKKSKTWYVYDFDIEGVSLVQTYRSQFAGVLQKQSIEELLKQLEKETSTANKETKK